MWLVLSNWQFLSNFGPGQGGQVIDIIVTTGASRVKSRALSSVTADVNVDETWMYLSPVMVSQFEL